MNKLIALLMLMLLMTASLQAQETLTHEGVPYTVERYIVANYPVALAFAPDGRLFYTEKTTGSVRVISAQGDVQDDPVMTLPTSSLAERGMFGIALDPDYDANGHIWVAHTAEATATDFAALRIVRFTEADGLGREPEVMLSIPLENNALIHLGGNLHFDSDGLLYFSAGDQENPADSQDLTTLPGKLHRFAVTDEGLVPAPDNPFEGSSIYAYGLRNPFDFAFDPYNAYRLYATENGDQCDDEVNLILPGFNYGAGEGYRCGSTARGVDLTFYQPPMVRYTPTEAPTGIIVYDHEAIPEWQGDVFYCTWNNGKLRRMILNENRTAAEDIQEIDLGEAQCRIDLAVGPEGGLYFTMVGAEGGAIYRLLPG